MSEKTFKIVGGDISDGYHTFGELYEHRHALFIALCLMRSEDVVWKKDHYEGWDCVYLKTSLGQISYHVPAESYRNVLEYNFIIDESFEYDGHTSEDSLKRLRLLIGGLHLVEPVNKD